VPGGWSIAVEMMFYMVLPFLFTRIKNLNKAFNFFLITIVVRFLLELVFKKNMLITHTGLWESYLFFYFPGQLPIFALGIIIIKQQKLQAISGQALPTLSVLIILQLATGINGLFSEHILFGAGFLALGIALSIYRFALIVNPVIKYIGKISFSMYLVHFAVLYWLTKWNFIDYVSNDFLNFGLRFLCVTIITILLSSVTYYCVEVPFQKVGKRLIERFEGVQKQAV
jgi:peptidoglycan/LPS O-acetylase OafA/YrhL